MNAILAILILAQQAVGYVTNDCVGRLVFVWTNTPPCLRIEGTSTPQDTNSWVRLVGITRWDGGNTFEYTVEFNATNSFYRLKQAECCP